MAKLGFILSIKLSWSAVIHIVVEPNANGRFLILEKKKRELDISVSNEFS